MNERRNAVKKGALFSGLEQVIGFLLAFVIRRVILISIGLDYLGLNSTLSQLLGALSVTELGIQGVITYKLYKPVVEGDRDKICELMSVIRFFYRIVALIIVGGAIVILPFLPWLITDVSIPWTQVYIAWIMMAASSALSYTMNYNCTIIYADQKQYVYQRIHLVLNLFIVSVNLLALYYLKNYYLYLFLNLANTLSGNIVLLILRRKMYPWVRFVKTTWNMVREVTKDTLDAFAGRICAYIFNSTDNIVISALISTPLVGSLGNYSTLTLAVAFIISSICGPVQAVVGNMLVSDNKAFLVGFIKKYTYILYVIGCMLILPTALLLDDFVILLYGSEYVVDHKILYLLIAYVYLSMTQSATGSILDADGQFRIEKHFYIVSSLINIILSIIGALTIGVAGVLIATAIGSTYLLFCRVYYCFKCVVKDTGKPLIEYYIYILKMLLVFGIGLAVLRGVFNIWLPKTSIVMFVVKGIIAVATSFLIQIIFYGRTDEYKYALQLSGVDRLKTKILKK